jgi:hypothetical protein
VAFFPNIGSGIPLPQRYRIPTSPAQTIHVVSYSDGLGFAPEKRGLFPLVVFVDSIADIPDAMKILSAIGPGPEDIGQVINEATYISLNIQPPRAVQTMTKLSCRIVRVAAVEDFRQSKLSIERAIQGYNPSSLKKSVNGKRFVIVRPGRLVFVTILDEEVMDHVDPIQNHF